jgi:histidinol-phosphate aminotransferase
VTVPLTAAGRLDLAAIAAAITPATRVVMICTPNNPTGPAVHEDEFAELMARVPKNVLVAVDNAYAEFVLDPDAIDPLPLISQYDNLVVLRTFSKAYGLAGLRVGYALAKAEVAGAIRSVTPPFSVNAVAQLAATVSLELQDEMRHRITTVVQVRERLWQGLLEQGWAVPSAQGNFVWLPSGQQTRPLATACTDAGFAVRPFADEGVRITAAETETVDRVLAVTRQWI